jgi:hypothetical protein
MQHALEILDLIQWLTARLNRDPIIAGRAYWNHLLEKDRAKPYVTFSVNTALDDHASGGTVIGTPVLMVVTAICLPSQMEEGAALAGAIQALCHQVGEHLFGGIAIRQSYRQQAILLPGEETLGETIVKTIELGGLYRFYIHPWPIP